MLLNKFLVTFFLTFQSLTIALILGICLGIAFSFLDKRFFMIIKVLLSFPSFLFPIGVFFLIGKGAALAISIAPTLMITSILYKAINREMKSNYVIFAMLNGYTKSEIIFKQVLRNALFSVLGYLGRAFSYISTGSVIVERLFFIQGLGNYLIDLVNYQKYYKVSHILFIYILLNFTIQTFSRRIALYLKPELRNRL